MAIWILKTILLHYCFAYHSQLHNRVSAPVAVFGHSLGTEGDKLLFLKHAHSHNVIGFEYILSFLRKEYQHISEIILISSSREQELKDHPGEGSGL